MTILLFLLTFAVYLFTLAPSITVGDSGEFCAAATILGLCHSPGYPLFSLLGKAVSVALPLASYAFRINVLSALCGAATVTLLFACFKNVSKDETDGKQLLCLIAAALFGFSPAFWKGSIQAEVFTLNTLFAATIIYFALKNRIELSVFAFGLGLGNHHTLVFVAPVIITGIYRNGFLTAKKIVLLAVLFCLGFSVYAYLPARAAKKPGLNWGNPVNINNIARVISRADYGSLSLTVGAKIPRDITNTFKQVARFVKSVDGQFTVFGLIVGMLGLYYGVKNRYPYFRTIIFMWFIAGPGFLILANMPFNSETEGILERFYILVNLFWAFFMLAGVDSVLKGLKNVPARALIAAVITVLLVATRLGAVSWRGYYLAYDYGRNILRTLSSGAALFMDGGDDTFYSTAYLSFAEKKRPDVELHDRGGLVFRNVYGQDFRKLPKEEKEGRRREVERSFLAARPVYFSTFNRGVMPGVSLVADGVLYRPAGPKKANSFFAYSLRNTYDTELTDYRSRALAPIYPYFEAFYEPGKESAFWRYASLKWPDAMWLKGNLKMELLNAAYKKYSAGDFAGAAAIYEEALRSYPGDYETILNLGVAYEKQKNTAKAIECYNRAIALDPGKTDAYYNIAVICWQRSDWETAVSMFNKMLEIDPGDQRAKRFLPAARENLKRQTTNYKRQITNKQQ